MLSQLRIIEVKQSIQIHTGRKWYIRIRKLVFLYDSKVTFLSLHHTARITKIESFNYLSIIIFLSDLFLSVLHSATSESLFTPIKIGSWVGEGMKKIK